MDVSTTNLVVMIHLIFEQFRNKSMGLQMKICYRYKIHLLQDRNNGNESFQMTVLVADFGILSILSIYRDKIGCDIVGAGKFSLR